ncbi:MAG: hypothetical protein RXR41_03270 [Candidatus Marsarchaeota archaeon]
MNARFNAPHGAGGSLLRVRHGAPLGARDRNGRGLSSILGTIIVLVLTLTAGVMLWHTFSGLFSSLSQQDQLQLVSAEYVDTTSGSYVLVSVRNTGTSSLTLQGVQVEGVTSYDWSGTLQPGAQLSQVWQAPAEPEGTSYLLVVTALAPSGAQVQAEQVVTVSSD